MNRPDEPHILVLDTLASTATGIPVYYTVPRTMRLDATLVPMPPEESLSDLLQRVGIAVRTRLRAAGADRLGQFAFASLRAALAGFGTRSRRSAKQLR
jgi:hypothetical protein